MCCSVLSVCCLSGCCCWLLSVCRLLFVLCFWWLSLFVVRCRCVVVLLSFVVVCCCSLSRGVVRYLSLLIVFVVVRRSLPLVSVGV